MVGFLLWTTLIGAFTGLIGTFMVFFTSVKSNIAHSFGAIGVSLTLFGGISLWWMQYFN
ncbi:hypothetical protein [Arsenophonus sp.]|uniref:hypothetical protein n=1 Tax=Arsenophonus sp. TaxID=1872640 RepID=UPI0028671145|nr:hypothetical protein [Arsenophonus sp.]MDR5615302.1 hypothetical protein [Arsenophonus sp.]